jgi:restriction system protein
MADRAAIPPYHELIYPTLRAVEALGGSAKGNEITDKALELLGTDDDVVSLTYENRPAKSIFLDRLDWARSYAKLGGALESPRRGLFLLTTYGRDILGRPDDEARKEIRDLDRRVRQARATTSRRSPAASTEDVAEEDDLPADVRGSWEEVLLARLHRLTPDGFEEFVLYVLRAYGLDLERVGGSGDEGIDGIGLAPISDVLSSRVAVQAKRYDPAKTIGRETVALFQRDASAKGAERAVLVTLGRFSEPARKAAFESTPTVDLIDGEKLCALVRDREIGIRVMPIVNEGWFDRFD